MDFLKIFRRKSKQSPAVKLTGSTITVFVRQSNDSKTNIEHYVEQLFIERDAYIASADQRAGIDFLKRGKFVPLAEDANLTFVGTLIIRDGFTLQERVFTESEYDFAVRRSEYEAQCERWWNSDCEPEPILKKRESEIVEIPALSYELPFRLLLRDGTIIASGASTLVREKTASQDTVLYELAKDVVKQIDEMDIMSRIPIQ